jgi:hypothetical protein
MNLIWIQPIRSSLSENADFTLYQILTLVLEGFFDLKLISKIENNFISQYFKHYRNKVTGLGTFQIYQNMLIASRHLNYSEKEFRNKIK